MSHADGTIPETLDEDTPETGEMPTGDLGPAMNDLLRTLGNMAAMGDRLMAPQNRAARRAAKRAKRKKGK